MSSALVLNTEKQVLGLVSDLIYGISEYLAGSPYHLIVTPYSRSNDPLDPVRYIVETGSADGIIFSRTEPQDARVRYLHERGFPFATHGRTEMGIDHPFFDFDNRAYAVAGRPSGLAALGRSGSPCWRRRRNLSYHHHMRGRLSLTRLASAV